VQSDLVVRLAGFPFEWVDEFAAPATLAALGRRDEARDEAARLGASLLADLAAIALDAQPDPQAFKRAQRAVRKATKAVLDADEREALVAALGSAERVEAWQGWRAAGVEGEAECERAFEADARTTDEALRRLASDRRVQEAVFLMSPDAYDRVARLADGVDASPLRVRQRQALALSYLQRLCTKNETNAFFGPTAAGQFGEGGSDLEYAFRSPIRGRRAYFAQWAAQALFDRACEEPALAGLVRPRRNAASFVDGEGVWHALKVDLDDPSTTAQSWVSVRLPLELAEAVERADGETPASALGASPEALEELTELALVDRGTELPTGLFEPLAYVRGRLEVIGACPERDRWVGQIAEFEAQVDAAGGDDFDARRARLSAMEARFEELSGRPARRHYGRHYADRGLLADECEAGLEGFRVGGELAERLVRDLPAVCELCFLGASIARAKTKGRFAKAFGVGVEVPFLAALRWHQSAADGPVDDPLVEQLEAVRGRVIAYIRARVEAAGDEGARLSIGELAEILAPLSGRGGVAYQSVDMLLGRGADGRLQGVVGEVHSIYFAQPCLFHHLADAARLAEGREHALRDAVRAPLADVVAWHVNKVDKRLPLGDFDFVLGGRSSRPPGRAIDAGAATVALVDGEFRYTGPSGVFVPLLTNYYSGFVHDLCSVGPGHQDERDKFFPRSLLPPLGDFVPRIAVGDLVVRRAEWRLPATELRAALGEKPGLRRFDAVQALRAAKAMPRRVFFKAPGEPKPRYLDLASPKFVESWARIVQAMPEGSTLSISEMLPGADGLVLRDASGARTSELRMSVLRTETGS
jgi:Lantibiotic dehydratase, N terminus